MAAGDFSFFDATARWLMTGTNLKTATIKCALVGSGWTPNQDTNDEWADVSANEIANGNGYTTGGATVGSPVLTEITKGYKFSSANISWTATGGNIPAWRYAVFYVSGTIDSVTNPVLGYFLGDSTPADTPATSVGNTLALNCPAGGWFDNTRP